MLIVHLQKALKIFRTLRTSLHRKEVDDLNEQQRLPVTRFTHRLDEFAQPRNKTIVANAKQWTTRNVAHARRLDDQHTRPAFGKTSIPVEIMFGDEAVFRRAPRHHRRYPRAAARFCFANGDRAKQSRPRRLVRRGPTCLEYPVPDGIRKFPHVLVTDYRITPYMRNLLN